MVFFYPKPKNLHENIALASKFCPRIEFRKSTKQALCSGNTATSQVSHFNQLAMFGAKFTRHGSNTPIFLFVSFMLRPY
jgi:hypothetical protein